VAGLLLLLPSVKKFAIFENLVKTVVSHGILAALQSTQATMYTVLRVKFGMVQYNMGPLSHANSALIGKATVPGSPSTKWSKKSLLFCSFCPT